MAAQPYSPTALLPYFAFLSLLPYCPIPYFDCSALLPYCPISLFRFSIPTALLPYCPILNSQPYALLPYFPTLNSQPYCTILPYCPSRVGQVAGLWLLLKLKSKLVYMLLTLCALWIPHVPNISPAYFPLQKKTKYVDFLTGTLLVQILF